MKKLSEWNSDRRKEFKEENNFPKLNGILCDKCGAELQDTDGMLLLSYPAQRNVKCSKCDFTGYRVE